MLVSSRDVRLLSKTRMFYQRDGEVMILAIPTLLSSGIVWIFAGIDMWRQNYSRSRQLAWIRSFRISFILVGMTGNQLRRHAERLQQSLYGSRERT